MSDNNNGGEGFGEPYSRPQPANRIDRHAQQARNDSAAQYSLVLRLLAQTFKAVIGIFVVIVITLRVRSRLADPGKGVEMFSYQSPRPPTTIRMQVPTTVTIPTFITVPMTITAPPITNFPALGMPPGIGLPTNINTLARYSQHMSHPTYKFDPGATTLLPHWEDTNLSRFHPKPRCAEIFVRVCLLGIFLVCLSSCLTSCIRNWHGRECGEMGCLRCQRGRRRTYEASLARDRRAGDRQRHFLWVNGGRRDWAMG